MNAALDHPVEVVPAAEPLSPVVLSSPHSGSLYPPMLLDAARLGLDQLRRLEDGFVHQLLRGGPARGAPLLHARFARAFIDPNREPYEVDPELLAHDPPEGSNTTSLKARAGLGTVPSRVGTRAIYRRRLELAEIERRLALAYWPYHAALRRLLDQARARFGVAVLLDGHSMPGLAQGGEGVAGVDAALGDRYGRSCAPELVALAEEVLRGAGLRVARNRPYAGGFITAHYGSPETGVHAVQLELRRSLYMDERRFRLLPEAETLARILDRLVEALAAHGRARLWREAAPGPAELSSTA